MKKKIQLETIEDIQKAAINPSTIWPDTVYVHKKDDLLLFNYRPKVQYDNLWTNFELMCRGLIINKNTGEIVARPFDKFFNWGENNRTTNTRLINITEKLDGSLGIHYRLKEKVLIATKGSFESTQAIWATKYLNKHHNIKDLYNDWTLLFEIIYPDNRIIIDYGEQSNLILLAIRNRFTGNYISNAIVRMVARKHDFKLPEQCPLTSIDTLIKKTKILPLEREGYVAEFTDGKRFKFKGEEYKKVCKLMSGLSFKRVVKYHQEGIIQQIKESIPDELYNELDNWINVINNTITDITERVEIAYEEAPKNSRKEYALWVQQQEPSLSPYLFARIDKKNILPLIYKLAFY